MKLNLYSTLSKNKTEFKPLDEKLVRMYSCGPTVYSFAHIGNFRAYIFNDTLRRVIKYNGYNIKHVMNITDVGHLTSDSDEGEDKMEKAARKEGKDPYKIAEFYTDAFFKDFDKLNLERPEIITKATDNISEMELDVKELIDKGFVYETSKALYFDISKLDKYPVLSNRDIEDQIAGARVDVDPEKKSPYDFAVWIKAPENHLMKWESPWGLSYPGWHLECSTMSRRFLGDKFDIHTGGVDHIPTHHENEIAQSKGLTGSNPASYWMHNEFLQVDGGKMSKSLGNIYTIETLEEKGISPLGFKLFNYTAHYRTKLNFTFESVKASQKSLERLYELYLKHKKEEIKIDNNKIEILKERFLEFINDDLNIPGAMGLIWEILRGNELSKDYASLIENFDLVLGLDIRNAEKRLEEFKKYNEVEEMPEEIKHILEERKIARENKDWNKSDELRDKLINLGFNVKDTKDGQELSKIS